MSFLMDLVVNIVAEAAGSSEHSASERATHRRLRLTGWTSRYIQKLRDSHG